MKSTVTSVFAVDPRVRYPAAHKMHVQATMLVQDAEVIRHRPSAGPFLLAAYGIELALKSFLLNHGKSEQDIAKLSHRLTDVVEACTPLGLPVLDNPTGDVVLELEKAQVRSALRYDLEHHLPAIDLVLVAAHKVLKLTHPPLPT